MVILVFYIVRFVLVLSRAYEGKQSGTVVFSLVLFVVVFACVISFD